MATDLRAPSSAGAPIGGAAAAGRPAGGALAVLRRCLACLRYGEILLLQGSPFFGAAFALRGAPAGRLAAALPALLGLLAGSTLLVAYIFVFNDWSGLDADLNDARKVAGVFTTKGLSRTAVRNLWAALLVLGLLLFALLGRRPLAVAAAIAVLGYLYSRPGHPVKSRPVFGTLLHLAGGTLHFLLGYTLFRPLDLQGTVLALFFGLAFAAGHLNQEVRDHEGDIRNRIQTNAVAFGPRAAFFAGLVLFTLAYVHLLLLAILGPLPRWLAGLVALLYPLHLQAARKALAAGLTFEAIDRFQHLYRALFALIGAALLAALLLARA